MPESQEKSISQLHHHVSHPFVMVCSLLSATAVLILTWTYPVHAATMAERMKGRILLQVERNGEAWYVYPKTLTRFFLGRQLDAFRIMRYRGLGITDANLKKIPRVGTNDVGDATLQARLSGYILLQVEKNGEAWYVYPAGQRMPLV